MVTRHYHFYTFRESDFTRYVERTNVELRTVVVVERSVTTTFFFLQDINLSFEFRVRFNLSRVADNHTTFDFILVDTTEQRNARIQIENQQLRIQELELALRADMSNFWMAYKNNLDLWSLEKENLVAAQENYRIAIDRYKLGELSGIELREAQNSLLEAEERLSVAEYSTKICEISLLQLSGQILTYIRPEPEKASF